MNNAHAMCTIKQRFLYASKAFIFCIAFPVLPFLREITAWLGAKIITENETKIVDIISLQA